MLRASSLAIRRLITLTEPEIGYRAPEADAEVFQWMRIFAAFPDRDSGGAWNQADRLQWDTRRDVDSLEATVRTFFGRVSEDAIIPVFSSAPFVPDHDYWRRNIRKLGLWYFQELQSLMRGVFERHLYCTLAPFVPNRLTNVPGNCLVAQALWDCASLIWGTGAALDWPTMNRRALSKLEQHLVHRIFDRKKAAYLGDEAAELVVRATALMFFASALERRLKEKSERFYRFREKDAAGIWSAAGVAWEMKEGRFRISTSLVRELMARINGLGGANCSYPDELRYCDYDPQPAYRERQATVQVPPQ